MSDGEGEAFVSLKRRNRTATVYISRGKLWTGCVSEGKSNIFWVLNSRRVYIRVS